MRFILIIFLLKNAVPGTENSNDFFNMRNVPNKKSDLEIEHFQRPPLTNFDSALESWG